jgi:hypothetical protein
MVNRRRMFLGLVGAVAAGGVASAVERPSYGDAHGTDYGRAWMEIDQTARQLYLVGFKDSLQDAGSMLIRLVCEKIGTAETSAFQKVCDSFFPDGVDISDIAKAITKLYENPVNVRVAVPWMLVATAMQFNGQSAEAVEKYLTGCRTAPR